MYLQHKIVGQKVLADLAIFQTLIKFVLDPALKVFFYEPDSRENV